MTEPRAFALVSGSTRVELVLDAVSHGVTRVRDHGWSPRAPLLPDSDFVMSYMRNTRSRACAEVFHLKWGNGLAEPSFFLRDCNGLG
jgi:hypothetical protein